MKENLPFDDFVKQQFRSYSPDVPGHIWENIVAKRKSRPKGFWVTMLSGRNLLALSLVMLVGGGVAYYMISPNSKVASTQKIPPGKEITQPGKINSLTQNTAPGNKQLVPPADRIDNSVKGDNNVAEQPVNSTNDADQNTLVNSSAHSNRINSIQPSTEKSDAYNEEKSMTVMPVTANNTEASYGKLSSPFGFNNARNLSTKELAGRANIKLPNCPTLEKNAAGNKTYWEVYAGPDHAFENYKSYGDTASANYLQKRKSSTEFASAFSAGVRYTKVFTNGTSVRAGLNYTQVNEKFLYFNPSEIKYVTVITTRVVVRAPGDTLYFNDTLQYQQTGTRIKTTYNRYRNIDVPLVIGYELGNGKIHANINAGVIINVYSWYKGDVLDSLYQPVNITTGKGNSVYQFKNNIGVGFLGSISLYYKLNDNLHLVLEPYFRYNLSPMSKENLNLQQKYNIAGLRAGVRFDLK